MSVPTDPPDGGGGNRFKKRRNNDDVPQFGKFSFPSLQGENGPVEGQYLLIESLNKDKPVTKYNLFAVEKFLERFFSHGFKVVRRLKEGSLLVYVKSTSQADKSIGEAVFDATNDVRVKIEKHRTMNRCKGRIYCPELCDMEDKEICAQLKDQKVIEVRRLKKKVEGDKLQDTGAFVFTFDRFQIPEKIKIGYLMKNVEMYYDNPMRCTKCQEYGHTKNRCKKETEICRTCAVALPHQTCGPKKCVNCGLGHPSNDPSCAKRKEGEAVVRLMTDERLSFYEARKRFEEKVESAKKSLPMAMALQQQEEQKRNGPAVSREEITQLSLMINALTQRVTELEAEVKVRDELLKKHNVPIPQIIKPRAVPSSSKGGSAAHPKTQTEQAKEKPEPKKPSSTSHQIPNTQTLKEYPKIIIQSVNGGDEDFLMDTVEQTTSNSEKSKGGGKQVPRVVDVNSK